MQRSARSVAGGLRSAPLRAPADAWRSAARVPRVIGGIGIIRMRFARDRLAGERGSVPRSALDTTAFWHVSGRDAKGAIGGHGVTGSTLPDRSSMRHQIENTGFSRRGHGSRVRPRWSLRRGAAVLAAMLARSGCGVGLRWARTCPSSIRVGKPRRVVR